MHSAIFPHMTSNSRLRPTTGTRAMANITIDMIKTSHGSRKIKNTANPIEQLRNLTKSNQDLSIKISEFDLERERHFERIKMLQEHLIKDEDLISGLKSKIYQLTMGEYTESLMDTATKKKSLDKTNPLFEEIHSLSPSNCVDYLKNRPMILTYIVGFDEDFVNFSLNIDSETQLMFLSYSFSQLMRFSDSFSLFQTLSAKLNSLDFLSVCNEKLRGLFYTNTVLNLIRDQSTTKFNCNQDGRDMRYEIDQENSSISSSLSNQDVIMLNEINISDAPRLDVVLNPNGFPSIILPTGHDSAFLIISENSNNVFTPEDQIVAIFLSHLLTPLYEEHLNFLNLLKQTELRRSIHLFQKELINKTNCLQLLPFLYSSISGFTGANDIELFFLGNNIFYTFDAAKNQLKKKVFKYTGIPKRIIETKEPYFAERLNSHEHTDFDTSIDMWCLNKSFVGFPIINNENEAIAVLSMTEKNQSNSFSSYDIEYLQEVSSSLSTILPHIIESEGENPVPNGFSQIQKFANHIFELTKDKVHENNAIQSVMKMISDLFNSEWLTIFVKQNDDSIKQLMTLDHGEVSNDRIIHELTSEVIFGQAYFFSTDMNEILTKYKIDLSFVRSMLAIHNGKVALFCFDGNFKDDISRLIFQSCLSIISDVIEIHSLTDEIQNSQNLASSVRNVLNVTTTAMLNENPLNSLLSMICELISMSNFCLFKLNQGEYEPVIHSQNIQCSIKTDDVLIDFFKNNWSTLLIKQIQTSEYSTSNICHCFTKFNSIVLTPIELDEDSFLAFSGDSITSNYSSLLSYFSPIISLLYCKNINQNKEKSTIDFDKFLNTEIDVSDRLFAVNQLSEDDLVSSVFKMFENLELISFLTTNKESFIKSIFLIRSAYNQLSFHNWRHAVDVTQFVYSCIIRGDMITYFSSIQLVALLFACLCHDVYHEGVNTTYHVKSQSSVFWAFGEQSPLERFHATKAAELLEKTEFFNVIDCCEFWRIFVNSIVATDMVRHFEFLENFNQIVDNYEINNDLHRLSLAQFLIKCGNFANATRPFDLAFEFAQGLLNEYKNQSEKEKEINIELTRFGDENDESSLWSIETAFYVGIVSPTFQLLSKMFPNLHDFKIQMEDNRNQWEDYGQKQQQNY